VSAFQHCRGPKRQFDHDVSVLSQRYENVMEIAESYVVDFELAFGQLEPNVFE
jgi:hypothetical protein